MKNEKYLSYNVWAKKAFGFGIGLFFLFMFLWLGYMNLANYEDILAFDGVWFVIFTIFYEVFLLLVSFFSFKYAFAYNIKKEKEIIKKGIKATEEQALKIKKKELERKSYPHHVDEHTISLVSLSVSLIGTSLFGIVWLFTKEIEYLYIATPFILFMFLFGYAMDFEGKRINNFEKRIVDFASIISSLIKWPSIIIIALTIIYLLGGWIASLSATSIIIILLVLILLKK